MMTLLPYGSHRFCPMCAGQMVTSLGLTEWAITQYCDQAHPGVVFSRGKVQWLDAQGMSPTSLPHLHRTCRTCGYEWLEKTYRDNRD